MICKDCGFYLDDSDRCVKRGYCNKYSTKQYLCIVHPNDECKFKDLVREKIEKNKDLLIKMSEM